MLITISLISGSTETVDTTNVTTAIRQENSILFAGVPSPVVTFMNEELADDAFQAIRDSYLHGHGALSITEVDEIEKYESDHTRHIVPAHIVIEHCDDIISFN